MVATSTAADEDTPLPSGTAEEMRMERAVRKAHPPLPHQHDEGTSYVRSPTAQQPCTTHKTQAKAPMIKAIGRS